MRVRSAAVNGSSAGAKNLCPGSEVAQRHQDLLRRSNLLHQVVVITVDTDFGYGRTVGDSHENMTYQEAAMTSEPQIRARLQSMLESTFDPARGCWPLRGYNSEYSFKSASNSHVLDVWPVGMPDPRPHEGNGDDAKSQILCELAELDFTWLANEISVERFHFCQVRSVFEILWREFGTTLELRIHVAPAYPGADPWPNSSDDSDDFDESDEFDDS